jgi:hypothetical protein
MAPRSGSSGSCEAAALSRTLTGWPERLSDHGMVAGMFFVRRVVRSRLFIAIYLIVGLIVAHSHHYFAHLGKAKAIASAVLAILLWPLVLLGVNLHIK